MQELTYYVASTLDGYIAHDDGSFDGFVWDDEFVADFFASYSRFDVVLMGRKTYEVGLREGTTSPYPALRQVVFSRTMEKSPDENVELVSEGGLERIRQLKAEDGKGIWLCGGADLASQCLEAGLLDRLIVKVNPVLFGSGIPLFTAAPQTALDLRKTTVYDCGITVLDYRLGSTAESS